MRLVLNVIWLLFGGLWLALGYALAALVCFLLLPVLLTNLGLVPGS